MKDKLKKYLGTGIAFILMIVILLLAAFFPEKRETEAEVQRIVRVWNVDTFEGGKGSRTTFLKNAARRTERKREGVYYLVSSYTQEGAEAAFKEGIAPDMLSFGLGLSVFAEQSLPIVYSFSGGELGGETLAYPWCRGGYALFSLTDNFEEAGQTAISCGGNNLPQVAAALSGIEGEELPALTAYTLFLQGKYRYLLGTQRDLCRFQSRDVSVYYKPLNEYCDLYQYLSILSEEKREDCEALLQELISAPEKMKEIGMYPLAGDNDFAVKCAWTADVFSSKEGLLGLLQTARAKDKKNLEKILKTI